MPIKKMVSATLRHKFYFDHRFVCMQLPSFIVIFNAQIVCTFDNIHNITLNYTLRIFYYYLLYKSRKNTIFANNIKIFANCFHEKNVIIKITQMQIVYKMRRRMYINMQRIHSTA